MFTKYLLDRKLILKNAKKIERAVQHKHQQPTVGLNQTFKGPRDQSLAVQEATTELRRFIHIYTRMSLTQIKRDVPLSHRSFAKPSSKATQLGVIQMSLLIAFVSINISRISKGVPLGDIMLPYLFHLST